MLERNPQHQCRIFGTSQETDYGRSEENVRYDDARHGGNSFFLAAADLGRFRPSTSDRRHSWPIDRVRRRRRL
jgi:hypothetical protein